jgi:hypothetical protein
MPPLTRYQEAHPYHFIFRRAPLSGDTARDALRRGVWVYLNIPARKAHLYGLVPRDYLVNYMTCFPGNHLERHLLLDALQELRAFFRAFPDQDLYTNDTTALVPPGKGKILEV